jgi:hypothetical protein
MLGPSNNFSADCWVLLVSDETAISAVLRTTETFVFSRKHEKPHPLNTGFHPRILLEFPAAGGLKGSCFSIIANIVLLSLLATAMRDSFLDLLSLTW